MAIKGQTGNNNKTKSRLGPTEFTFLLKVYISGTFTSNLLLSNDPGIIYIIFLMVVVERKKQ